jgi:pyruvate dehydrogenase E1 component alpha subunit
VTQRKRASAKSSGGSSNGSSKTVSASGPAKSGSTSSKPSVMFHEYPAGSYDHESLGLDDDAVLDMYSNMLLQRRFEQRANQMYGKQKIAGFLHLYIGQEAVSAGAARAIEIGKDSVITAYRDHGIGLALGMTANECMAEMFGKVGGCSKGKGGSMHFFSKEKRLFGGHGIVGAHVPVGTGIAFAHKYNEDHGVCLAFYGDGAVGQGAIHEAMNLASLYKLPIVFIIENNEYAMGTATHRAFGQPRFTHMSMGYDIPAAQVDGMDALSVCKAIGDHVAMARDFQPSLLEIKTYRYLGHSVSDPQKYRTKEELDNKKEEDPIIRMKSYIIEKGLADNDALDVLDAAANEEVKASVEFAENSPFPDLSAIYEDVYSESDYPFLK